MVDISQLRAGSQSTGSYPRTWITETDSNIPITLGSVL